MGEKLLNAIFFFFLSNTYLNDWFKHFFLIWSPLLKPDEETDRWHHETLSFSLLTVVNVSHLKPDEEADGPEELDRLLRLPVHLLQGRDVLHRLLVDKIDSVTTSNAHPYELLYYYYYYYYLCLYLHN